MSAPYKCPDDPRELGVRVRKMHVESTAGSTFAIPLDICYSDVLKRVAPRDYVHSLIDVASSRPAELDVLFQDTRGPNSGAMEDWLEKTQRTMMWFLGIAYLLKRW